MKKDIILLDGASGTTLWNFAEEQGLAKDPVWMYNVDHPELVTRLAQAYIEAGSQIIFSNTFGANGPALERFPRYSVVEVVSAGVRLAKEAAQGTGVKVALDIGPLSVLMEPYGDLEEEEVADIYREMMDAGMSQHADLIMLETFMDLEMLKVAAQVAKSYGVPVLCSMSFEQRGRTLMGNCVEDIAGELAEIGVDAVGLNCSLGPDAALSVIREFAEKTSLPLIFKPNAGMPVTAEDGSVLSPYTADTFADEVAPALELVTYLGSCCGSSPDYIRTLRQRLQAQ